MTAAAWRWIKEDSVLAIHEEQITEHGGLAGVRDLALLQSALARPQHRAEYENPDAADLAAAYAVGIARNHPFLDGNKRTAWVVSETFLLKSGYVLGAGDHEGVTTMLAVAEGSMPEPEFAAWLRANIQPRETK
jgi:death-on-curing protein